MQVDGLGGVGLDPSLFSDQGNLPSSGLAAGAQPPAEAPLGLQPQVLPGGAAAPPGTPLEVSEEAAPGTPLGTLGHQGLNGAPSAPPPVGVSGGPQPGISGSGERTASRSPRRTNQSPLPRLDGSDDDADRNSQSPPPSKLPRGSVHDDAHKSRGRSASSAASAGSSKSAAGLSHQHYADIASQIQADNGLHKETAGSKKP